MESRSTVNTRKRAGAKLTEQVSSEASTKISKPKPTKARVTKKISKKRNGKQVDPDPCQSDITTSADEMPLIRRMSLKKRIVTNKTTANLKVAIEKKTVPRKRASKVKQPAMSTVNQSATQQRRFRNRTATSQEEICNQLFDKCDKRILFNMMVKTFDGEEILKGYKQKRNTWEKQKIQEEASRVLNIDLENQTTVDTNTKISSLQKVLQELLNLVESRTEFLEMILKTYGRELDAMKFFELLNTEQMKQVVQQKLSANELMDLFKQSDNRAVICQILEMASVDAIVHEIQVRNDSETSQTLLNVLLELVSELAPDAILHIIKSKKFFRTSETLLNYMLENVQEILSKETKMNISNVLINQFKTDELVDLSHKAIKSSLSQNKKISLVEIED